MIDSFSSLFPESKNMESIPSAGEQSVFLSSILIQIIDKHIDSISQSWQRDLSRVAPGLMPHLDLLSDLHRSALRGIQFWLKREVDTLGVEEFIETGQLLRSENIPLPDVLSAMALSRKALWKDILSRGIVTSPLKIYTALEINNRIIFFYDKINYNLTRGYFS
jgi:hypothetical protein